MNIHYGVQTIFSTIPNQKDIKFEDDVEENYFLDYKTDIGSDTDDSLYKPLKFYMLGDYDVCYISLINNFKFSHRLFEPKNKSDNTVYHPHTFQSYAGFGLNSKDKLEEIFKEQNSKYFVGVINLKLNNGLLIGNGLALIESIGKLIQKQLGSTTFVLTQTFSWFELSLAVFVDDTKDLSKILVDLRLSEFKDLENHYELTNSLYHEYFSKGKIKSTSLFADTHTYFGFNHQLIKYPLDDPYIKDFIKHVNSHNVCLKTEVEWQVKPGHITAVEKIIEENTKLSRFFNIKETKLVLGKCDYMLQESEDSILANFYLVRYLNRTKNNKILQHIRKVRSYIFLEASNIVHANPNAQKDKSQPISWNNILEKLAVASSDFHFVDKRLKALKVSRQIRIKILKIFSNYNNGIQDPILFPLFLDFTIFIRNLIKLTEFEQKESETKSYKLQDLEKKLNEHIKVFQEGYAVRFLNGYQFENISDFDLDFNSSIQQLLTSYGTLVHDYGKLFYEGNNYAPIIQLNNTDTVSNNLSINYSTHHLTSPEFVFSTLLKEILNQFDEHNDVLKDLLHSFYEDIQSVKDHINESYLDDMIDSNLVDMNYFIIDAIRFIVTFNGDFQLFSHWFWTYNFQNSSLYDTSGMFNEQHLRMEMLRILLVKNFYSISEDMECPVPELYTYWQRHIKKIERISAELVQFIKYKEIDSVVELLIKKYLKTYKSYQKEYSEDLITRLNDIAPFSFVDKDHQLSKLSFINSSQPNVKSRKIHLMERLMFESLHYQFEQNNKQIILLKRDWKEGTSLQNHGKLYQDRMYAIDQTGGVYFNNINSMNLYFSYNAHCLLQIIHFSYLSKKDFIIKNSNLEYGS